MVTETCILTLVEFLLSETSCGWVMYNCKIKVCINKSCNIEQLTHSFHPPA